MKMIASSKTFAAATIIFCGTNMSQEAFSSTIENAVDTTGLSGFIGLSIGDHTVNSGIEDVVEVDGYTFQGSSGEPVRLIVSSLTGGLDPQMSLRDPTGAVIQTVTCDGSNFGLCSINLDQTLPSTGAYTLNVSDVNSDEIGSYSLHIDDYPPTNNWVGFAADSPVLEALGHVSDMDFLAFNGAAGTEVRLTARSFTGGLDPQLEVWDPLGNLISDTFCDGSNFGLCTTSADLALSLTGIYKVGLTDVGWNEIGDYDLGLSCLFGDCPTTSPVVPIPPAVWLFGSGLLGLIGIARRKAAA